MRFPQATWTPTRDEYFSALAPATSYPGTHPGWGLLHGSSALKRAEKSLRTYGEVMAARLAALASPELSSRCSAVLESQKSTRATRLGSAVESLVMPGDPLPEDLTPGEKRIAKIKAEQILEHRHAGRFLRAQGAAYQVAHRWLDEASGLWFRMRLDLAYWAGDPPAAAVQDLKVWSRIDDERKIRYKIRDNGADLQAAIYRRGCLDLWGVEPPHSLVIADPSILGGIYVYRLKEETIAEADARVTATAAALAECYRTGKFNDPAEEPKEI